MPHAELSLPPEPQSVGRARRLLRESLADWGIDALEFTACQALTELATNAVLHARTDFDVVLELKGDVLRVCVGDRSPRLPVPRSYAVDAATGRGLRLVDQLCRSWGVERTEDGKRVWFEIDEGTDARREDEAAADWQSGWSDLGDDQVGQAEGTRVRAA